MKAIVEGWRYECIPNSGTDPFTSVMFPGPLHLDVKPFLFQYDAPASAELPTIRTCRGS
jgi:hypothetical protein